MQKVNATEKSVVNTVRVFINTIVKKVHKGWHWFMKTFF